MNNKFVIEIEKNDFKEMCKRLDLFRDSVQDSDSFYDRYLESENLDADQLADITQKIIDDTSITETHVLKSYEPFDEIYCSLINCNHTLRVCLSDNTIPKRRETRRGKCIVPKQ